MAHVRLNVAMAVRMDAIQDALIAVSSHAQKHAMVRVKTSASDLQ